MISERWHSAIQQLFDKSKREIVIGKNRTDVLLNDFAVLEIQHSYISGQDIRQRNDNYKQFGKQVIWWVDCQKHQLNDVMPGQRYNVRNAILKALCNQSVPVYIDLGSKDVWQIAITKRPQDKQVFIELINKYTRTELAKLLPAYVDAFVNTITLDKCVQCNQPTILDYNYDICVSCHYQQRQSRLEQQPHIYGVRQAGAGNAKTYTIVQQALDNLGVYENILFVVKTNGTKQIIIDKIDELIKEYPDKYSQWQIRARFPYLNIYYIEFSKYNERTQIMIATIDSFFCSLGCQNNITMKKTEYSPLDFAFIADQIGSATHLNQEMQYKNISIQSRPFNTLFVLDEAQDLKGEYCNAMFNLFSIFNMDFLIVGDKLQTIYIDTYDSVSPMQLYQNILQQSYQRNIEFSPNVCNRLQYGKDGYSSENMIMFINQFIKFGQFGLPHISNKAINMGKNDVKIFKHHDLAGQSQQCVIDNIQVVTNIIKHHCELDNTLLPQDFHVIVPIVKGVEMLLLLETEISMFWVDYLQNRTNLPEVYNIMMQQSPVFCKLHKSETDGIINLGVSIHMTRIYSIHASKGEGRQISIILGLNQSAIERHSTICGDLKYESLLHVAVTRQKRFLYIGYSQSSGDVYTRLQQFISQNKSAVLDTGIQQQIQKYTQKIKADKLYKCLLSSEYSQQQKDYSGVLKYLFKEQYSLQQLEYILLADISSMINNYELPQPDMNTDDYELRDLLFKYVVKQNICTTSIAGNLLMRKFYSMGYIFKDNEINDNVCTMGSYVQCMQKKQECKRSHINQTQGKQTRQQCVCDKKILLCNKNNGAMRQICADIKEVYSIMAQSKGKGLLKLHCPVQILITVFFKHQHQYAITPSKLYYMMSKIRRGLFKVDCCSCQYCGRLTKSKNTQFKQFYKQIFNQQITKDLSQILESIVPAQFENTVSVRPLDIAKEIQVKSEIELYDQKTKTAVYVTQRLTDFNFRDILFAAIIDCYCLQNNDMIAVIASSNNQGQKNKEQQTFASTFTINIAEKIPAIEYLIMISYIAAFDIDFNQLLQMAQSGNKEVPDRLFAVYTYIEEHLDANQQEFLQKVNYHKQYCFLAYVLKKSRRNFISFI